MSKKRELDIPDFINRNHEIRKRNAARRARCFRNRIDNAILTAIKVMFYGGVLLLIASCFVLDGTDVIPWGMITVGSIISAVGYILLSNIRVD